MRVAVLCGDRWHPADVIRQGLEPLRREALLPDLSLNFVVDTSTTSGCSLDWMQQQDVLVVCKANGNGSSEDPSWLTYEVQQDIHDFVVQGGGLLVCHSGLVGYKDSPAYRKLVGGVFTHHPPHCPVTLEYIQDFGYSQSEPRTLQIHDEHYFVETEQDIHVFLQSTSEHGTQPAGWTRQEGRGRVCVLTPGHFVPVWQHPTYQQTLQTVLTWCAGQTV